MLRLIRIALTGIFVYAVYKARQASAADPAVAGDLQPAYYVSVCVILGFFAALTWAPLLGEKISGPLTMTMVDAAPIDRKQRMARLIRWCGRRRLRRWAVFLSFVEGVRRPWLPGAFLLGLQNSRPGSWWEKTFAKEVYRFDNVKNCVLAHGILKQHGIDPGPHPKPEVNLTLYSLQREPKPEAQVLPVPPAKPLPPLQRNEQIRLFRAEPSEEDRA